MIFKILKKLFIDSFSFNITQTGASGSYSFALGSKTTASGDFSHAEGKGVIASGIGSHAEGYYTTASGYGSHAEGSYTTASGYGSHAGGRESTASGSYSFTHGSFLRAIYDNEFVVGTYNATSSLEGLSTLFLVGNGTPGALGSLPNLSNALEVYSDGTVLAPSLTISSLTNPKTLINYEYLFSAEFGNALPTTDPLVAGKIWNNAGVLTVSAG